MGKRRAGRTVRAGSLARDARVHVAEYAVRGAAATEPRPRGLDRDSIFAPGKPTRTIGSVARIKSRDAVSIKSSISQPKNERRERATHAACVGSIATHLRYCDHKEYTQPSRHLASMNLEHTMKEDRYLP